MSSASTETANPIFQTCQVLFSRDDLYIDINGLPVLSADEGTENECQKMSISEKSDKDIIIKILN